MTDRFGEVNTCLDSLVDVFFNRVPEETTLQKVGLINIGKLISNVQILTVRMLMSHFNNFMSFH